MTNRIRQRRTSFFVLTVLLTLGITVNGHALVCLQDVSKQEAAELGITITARPSANGDTWVRVGFKTDGRMKGFTGANLDVSEGGKRLLSASLHARRLPENSPEGDTFVDYYVAPAALPNSTVTLVVNVRPRTSIGYRLRLKELLPAP